MFTPHATATNTAPTASPANCAPIAKPHSPSKSPDGSFRDRLATAAKRDTRPTTITPAAPARTPESALTAAPDLGGTGTPLDLGRVAHGAHTAGQSSTAASLAAPSRGATSPGAVLADVRTGRSAEGSHLHARVTEGRHAGIELRAVERDGRVSIELHAADPRASRMLRDELPEVRALLADRGLDTVTVHVADGASDLSQHPRPRDDDAFESPDDDRSDATDAMTAPRANDAVDSDDLDDSDSRDDASVW